ncbi:dynein heavy chain NDAI_0B05390 [Naumovozyma dairenensis CBS 421]|uniref:Dynein heavy chain, cytoplasmic n=1 Tax=Naumovozyma dairenensis (strain ATCC 10597 / BCRC 20456 / CBS 421 / NBRC 0211 / NRRL Y-12639) TaxID=1071378 RepID=G0W711_NAUDC|nr:hypothetical protein NDAI_0B05390 [Naumovozyma dairenensis CBS 421]CCD23572.1 hypothetical protein NDAI_0B05390 [Naumovozyma dairenensis CBS 421]
MEEQLFEELVDFCANLIVHKIVDGEINNQKDIIKIKITEKYTPNLSSFLNPDLNSINANTILINVNESNNDFTIIAGSECLSSNNMAEEGIHSLVLIIKNRDTIDVQKPLTSQLSALFLPQSENYESLITMLNFKIGSMFNVTKSVALENTQVIPQPPQIIDDVDDYISAIISEGADIDTWQEYLEQSRLDDFSFLNELQSKVNKWHKEISAFISITPNVKNISLNSELQLWSHMEASLSDLLTQLGTPDIMITLQILLHAKRVHLIDDAILLTPVSEKLKLLRDYIKFLTSFPKEFFDNSNTFEQIDTVVEDIHLTFHKLRYTKYPIERSLLLIQDISNQLIIKLLELISGAFNAPYTSFKKYMNSTSTILEKWDEVLQDCLLFLRESKRKSSESVILPKSFNYILSNIRKNTKDMRDLRKQHSKLQKVLTRINYEGYDTDLQQLYYPLTKVGLQKETFLSDWNAAHSFYQRRLIELEKKLINILKSTLAGKTASEEIIQELLRFKPLMDVNPRIKFQIKKYQQFLQNSIKKEIALLEDKHLLSKGIEGVARIGEISPLGVAINNDYQIKVRIERIIKRMEYLLGKDWRDTSDGSFIFNKYLTMEKSLGPEYRIENWIQGFPKQLSDIQDVSVIKILKEDKNSFQLQVNFDFTIVTILKDVRYLQYMDHDIPLHIINVTNSNKHICPHAIQILEQIQTFYSLLNELRTCKYTNPIFKKDIQLIWDLIEVAVTTPWSSLFTINRSLDGDVSQSDFIIELEDRISHVLNKFPFFEELEDKLKVLFESAVSNSTSLKDIEKIIPQVRSLVDAIPYISSEDVTNYEIYLDSIISELVYDFLKQQLKNLQFTEKIVTLTFKNGCVETSPGLQEIKTSWLEEIDTLLFQAVNISKVQKGNTSVNDPSKFLLLYKELKGEISCSVHELESIHLAAIEYLEQWRRNERMWDLNELAVTTLIGSDIKKSYSLLKDFFFSNQQFEQLQFKTKIGNLLTFQNQTAYAYISAKYNYWQQFLRDILVDLYMRNVASFLTSIKTYYTKLERISGHSSSLPDITELVQTINSAKTDKTSIEETVQLYQSINQLLSRYRIRRPIDYIYIEQVEGDVAMLNELASRKERLLQERRTEISSLLQRESQSLKEYCQSMLEDWENKKPVADDIVPQEALAITSVFKLTFHEIQSKSELIDNASKLLSLPLTIHIDTAGILDELTRYENAWLSIDDLWRKVETLMEQKWIDTDINHTILIARKISVHTAELSPNVTHFLAYQKINDHIKNLLKAHKILILLKDAALKPRHWKSIFQLLGGNSIKGSVLEEGTFSLRKLIEGTLFLYESDVNNIIEQAQKEYTVEKSLDRIKRFWETAQYTFSANMVGIRIVQEWDGLQDACITDLDELSAMKNSRYFNIFEQTSLDLEAKLTEFSLLQSSWIECQFYWLDLYGIIGKTEEMQKLLPLETTKFRNVTQEFKSFTARVASFTAALDTLHIPNVLTLLQNILDSLFLIKSSLNDFLEKQRKLFPRFYFLGNEDLLKLIGSNGNLHDISKYMVKMYATIDQVVVSGNIISGVQSPEGEVLTLHECVTVTPNSQTNIWLENLDKEIKLTLAGDVKKCLSKVRSGEMFLTLIDQFSFQVLLLAFQVSWTYKLEADHATIEIEDLIVEIKEQVAQLSSELRSSCESLRKKKLKLLLIEAKLYSSILTTLKEKNGIEEKQSIWMKMQRFFYHPEEKDPLKSITISQLTYTNYYGFEYIGVPERLIYTPLLMNAFSALTNSFQQGYGGHFFGPAGTGKTESVKALGQNLGKTVIVFNCDDTYDFQSMSRLLTGISQIGAWGCFDEFNRLDEKVLSAISQQIAMIQKGLLNKDENIVLMGNVEFLHPQTAIVITLNNEYEGRSQLPENLRKIFHEFSIKKADTKIIVDAILSIFGFTNSLVLADKLVTLFETLKKECSPQKHYDFGLRSIKKILKKCAQLLNLQPDIGHEQLIIESIHRILLPSLSKDDERIFITHLHEFFGDFPTLDDSEQFLQHLRNVCSENGMFFTDELAKKCLQLYNFQMSQDAIILLGDAGIGKSTILRLTLSSISALSGKKNIIYTIDTKVLSKEELYGRMNKATLEWTDGLFTSLIRDIHNDIIGTFRNAHIWIVFDSDIDPTYVETLNSVLDDNKILTLPNGERFKIPANLHLIFETTGVHYATPATITRCSLIWCNSTLLSSYPKFKAIFDSHSSKFLQKHGNDTNKFQDVTKIFDSIVTPELLEELISKSLKMDHIMPFDDIRACDTIIRLFFLFLERFYNKVMRKIDDNIRRKIIVKIKQIMLFSFTCGCKPECREEMINELNTKIKTAEDVEAITFTSDFDLVQVSSILPEVELDVSHVMLPDVIIPTAEILSQEIRYTELLEANKAIILCGPPGSGKTMTLNNMLLKSPKFKLVGMNFSKDTKISNVLRTLSRHTEYRRNANGSTLSPKDGTQTLVFFCDEINLTKPDAYNSQIVVLFLRQLIEKNGFWRTPENQWVTLERIIFVGACNPPSDVGRIPLAPTFIRHTCVVFVDYPRTDALRHIYKCYFKAILKLCPSFGNIAEDLSNCSVSLYNATKKSFTQSNYPHYVFSPRELTRLVRGFFNSLAEGPQQNLISLLKVWIYEAWRVFADRLTSKEDLALFQSNVTRLLEENFPYQDIDTINMNCLLFSDWLSIEYKEVSKEALFEFVQQRFQIFSEEEYDMPIVIYDEMLDHLLRIDRVFKQVQGHTMLIGAECIGKKIMTNFVAWLNGIIVLEPNIHRRYTLSDFDDFLRMVLTKCTLEERRVCLIIDESNILETAFLERMNTLLANADIPDLFQGQDYENLISKLQSKIKSMGLLLDTEQELYNWFTHEIARNLHVVFTISEPTGTNPFKMVSSPALFNRCVVNWMGTWSTKTMLQVANSLVTDIPRDYMDQTIPIDAIRIIPFEFNTFIDMLIGIVVLFDSSYFEDFDIGPKSPAHFVSAIRSLSHTFRNMHEQLEIERQFTINGLEKLTESVVKVQNLEKELSVKKSELEVKEQEARKTLDNLLFEQNESERKQEATEEIKIILEEREVEIINHRDLVIKELRLVEPAVLEARRGVQNIKKQQLTEIRSMMHPPVGVKLVLEAVCVILGRTYSTWRNIQQYISKDDFIRDIIQYDTISMMTPEMRVFVKANFLERSDFTFEAINRASKACGPLYQWVFAQVNYGEILERIEPLQQEVAIVEEETLKARARLLAAEEMIADLKESIEKSKNNYSGLIRDVEAIKGQIKVVHHNLERSKILVNNLTSEKERWDRNIKEYHSRTDNLIGTSILCAISSNYFGPLNEGQRNTKLKFLMDILNCCNLKYDKDVKSSYCNLNSTERARLIEDGLPDEEFLLEKMELAVHSEGKVLYIIDPSCQISDILGKFYGVRYVQISFLENGFVKRLENAIKFGGVVLIHNAEFYDPIISKLITGQFKKVGTRQIVQLGTNEIDVSPDFKLFLYSHASNLNIPTVLKTRTRIINFSIAKESIELQAVRIALTNEAPDVKQQKEELTKIGRDYKNLLKENEHQLLVQLNNSEGNILENDVLVTTLESLKAKSTEISKKLEESEHTMKKLNKFVEQYSLLGRHCFIVYSVLQKLSTIHWFYQFSIQQFLECVRSIFNGNFEANSGSSRIQGLIERLYKMTFSMFSPCLNSKNRNVLAAILYILYISIGHDDLPRISKEITAAIDCRKDKTLRLAPESATKELRHLFELLRDQSYNKIEKLICSYFDGSSSLEDRLKAHNRYGLIIGCEQNSDASFLVSDMADASERNLTVIPLGSSENSKYAEEEISRLQNQGGWLLLQNLQMSLDWVRSVLTTIIEDNRVLEDDPSKKEVKIFMTADLHGQELPISLLQHSYKTVYDDNKGLLESIKGYWFDSLLRKQDNSCGTRYINYRFLLTLFHAFVSCRSNLAPVGFSKTYDFNNQDYESCLKYLKHLVTLDVSENTCRYLLQYHIGTVIYGGKVDQFTDLQILQTICNEIFYVAGSSSPNDCGENVKVQIPGIDLKKSLLFESPEAVSDFLNSIEEPSSPLSDWLGIGEKYVQKYTDLRAQQIFTEVAGIFQKLAA